MNCTLEYVNGHIEVYDADGAFLFSADTSDEEASVYIFRSDYMPYIIEISMEKGNRAFYRCQGYCGRRKSPDQESAIWSGRIL